MFTEQFQEAASEPALPWQMYDGEPRCYLIRLPRERDTDEDVIRSLVLIKGLATLVDASTQTEAQTVPPPTTVETATDRWDQIVSFPPRAGKESAEQLIASSAGGNTR